MHKAVCKGSCRAVPDTGGAQKGIVPHQAQCLLEVTWNGNSALYMKTVQISLLWALTALRANAEYGPGGLGPLSLCLDDLLPETAIPNTCARPAPNLALSILHHCLLAPRSDQTVPLSGPGAEVSPLIM